MRTNLGQAEDRKRTCEGPHRQKVQFYQSFICLWFMYRKYSQRNLAAAVFKLTLVGADCMTIAFSVAMLQTIS